MGALLCVFSRAKRDLRWCLKKILVWATISCFAAMVASSKKPPVPWSNDKCDQPFTGGNQTALRMLK